MQDRDLGIAVGDRASASMTITERQIAAFVALSGDTHPMHLDPAYSAQTRFRRPIAHGVLGLALISTVLGTRIGPPDKTVVQLGQTVRFLKPVFPGDTLTAECEVSTVNPERRIAILDCRCTNQQGEEVLRGETTVMLDPFPYGAGPT